MNGDQTVVRNRRHASLRNGRSESIGTCFRKAIHLLTAFMRRDVLRLAPAQRPRPRCVVASRCARAEFRGHFDESERLSGGALRRPATNQATSTNCTEVNSVLRNVVGRSNRMRAKGTQGSQRGLAVFRPWLISQARPRPINRLYWSGVIDANTKQKKSKRYLNKTAASLAGRRKAPATGPAGASAPTCACDRC